MSKLSFLDKLGILVEVAKTSQVYLIALVVLLVFGMIISFTNKRNEKIHKMLYFGMTIVIIAVLVASYHTSLGKMMSYMMNNFFIAVYFPNIAIYLAAIIAMNIIVWISIFSYKSARPIRVLNVSIYVIMNYLMALLLKVITTNKLDIFDQASLYGNKEATAMIELSSIVFVVWVIFLTLYKIILIYIRKDYKPKVKRIIVRKKVKKLPENFEPLKTPEKVYGNIPHKETLIDTSEKTEEEILLEHFSKQFTLEDYKLFSRLLKEQQEKESTKAVDNSINSIEEVVENDLPEEIQEEIPQETVEEAIPELPETVEAIPEIVEEETEDYREAQKQEIIRMEEERRELLRQEQERQEQERQEKLRREARIKELEAKEAERERRKKEREEQREKERIQREQQELEEKRKQEQELEKLLQQTHEEEEKEQRKLSELEMLYR